MKPTVKASLTTLRKEREDYLKAKQAVVYNIEHDDRLASIEYGDDLTPLALNLVYDLFEPDTGSTTKVCEKEVEARYYRTHSQCLCGDPGIGKTLFHLAKAKKYMGNSLVTRLE